MDDMNRTFTACCRIAWVAALLTVSACGGGDSANPGDGTGDVPGEGGGDADVPGADADADADADVSGDDVGLPDDATSPDGAPCGTTQCSNCIDDDGDTLIDGFDPHCSSAADDDEGSFATGIPGDNRDRTWQDCFFDGNSGGGDDGCRYHTCCVLGSACPADLADHFDPATDCEISAECIDTCMPGTTPGCDCFGCCQIWVDGVEHVVYTNPALAPDCTLDVIGDPALCPPCTPTVICGNPCVPAECELCPGMTPDDLPPECSDTTPQCDDGVTPCATTADCPADYYCSLGCCIEDIIL
jgi:hypothetical protein